MRRGEHKHLKGEKATNFLWRGERGVRPSHDMDPETREAAILGHIKRIRSDPRWQPENSESQAIKGRNSRNSKLTEEQARYIKFDVAARYETIKIGRRQRFIHKVAYKFGVSFSVVMSIVTGGSRVYLEEAG